MSTMPSSCDMVFKEWALVCAALRAGRQTLLVRKGGIDEGSDGFRVEHSRFWLFPTQFHQTSDALREEFRDLELPAAAPHGQLAIDLLVEVQQTMWIDAAARLAAIGPLQAFSDDVLQQRFLYRSPGLFAIVVRAYRLSTPLLIKDEQQFAGCRSWVPLTAPLSTQGLTPVLRDQEFVAKCATISAALQY